MSKVLIMLLIISTMLSFASVAAAPKSDEHVGFTLVDKTDTGAFTTISIYNQGSNTIYARFYFGGTAIGNLHENISAIPAGTIWEPPGNGYFNTVAYGYYLTSAGSDATTNWE